MELIHVNRDKQIVKITKVMQEGVYDALIVAGVSEAEISKYINSFKDMYDIAVIINVLKALKPVCEKLMCFYRHYSPETWNNLNMTVPRVPELRVLADMKSDVRKHWRAKPRIHR